jgi:hypothetical protein
MIPLLCCLYRSCELSKPGSLEPLSTLSSLRHLILAGSPYIKKQAVTHLLSSAEQGCLLKMELVECLSPEVEQECLKARAALVAEKGSRNVPRLEITS